MKLLSILAAASLALTPAIASAGSGGENTGITDDGRPISGPLAVAALDPAIPVGAIWVGGFLIFGGVIICLFVCSDGGGGSNKDTNGAPMAE